MARGSVKTWWAESRRTTVTLNLGELEALLQAAVGAGAGTRKASHILTGAARRVERARDRRLRAVERTQTSS